MPSAQTIQVFAVAAILLLVVPGPSVFYLVTQSLANGRAGGLAAMAGVQAGGAVHIVAAAVGLSALLASSAAAFTVVKLAGAGYLVWIGVRRLLHPGSLADLAEQPRSRRTRLQLFRQGFVVNALNPKAALFFTAVLPQFIDPDLGRAWLQVLVLGAIFLLLAVISDGAWVLTAGFVASRIRSPRARLAERIASGTTLIALGVAAALQERSAAP